MAFFDDFANAVENYPKAKVTLTIEEVEVQTGTAGSVNVNEVWSFRVRIANNGHLYMNNVQLHIVGKNGAMVSNDPAGPWGLSALSDALIIGSHGSRLTEKLYFKAPSAAKPAGTKLVGAHISSWDADLGHILNVHSEHADPPEGTYAAKVSP